MRKLRNGLAPMAVAMLMVIGAQGQAGWWNPKNWGKKKVRRFDTLIVTGNFVKSRLLAELIQLETKQPILLLPGDDSEICYGLGPNADAIELREDQYLEFVEHIHPRRVLFLGNSRYVPDKYIELVKDRYAVWSVRNAEWETIAISCGDMLRLKDLAIDYLVLLEQMREAQRAREKVSGQRPAQAPPRKTPGARFGGGVTRAPGTDGAGARFDGWRPAE